MSHTQEEVRPTILGTGYPGGWVGVSRDFEEEVLGKVGHPSGVSILGQRGHLVEEIVQGDGSRPFQVTRITP